jgi:hypothetical protein
MAFEFNKTARTLSSHLSVTPAFKSPEAMVTNAPDSIKDSFTSNVSAELHAAV